MRRGISAAVVVAAALSGCATGRAPTPPDGFPLAERSAAPAPDPRAIGRPPELLDARGRARLEAALQARGLLDARPLPGEVREALLAAQRAGDLAPTGWLDEETSRYLGLDPDEMLPIVAGAGVYWTAGATAGGGEVGGEPGPASPVPDAVELGAEIPAGAADPAYQFEEARRLRAAARELRGRALRAESDERRRWFEAQAAKAEHLFLLHAEKLEELGGEAALAGMELPTGEEAEALVRGPEVEEGGEVRTAWPPEDTVELTPEEVERMQRALWAEGFLHQAPTARLDDATRQAVRAWQTAQGWEPTGAVDERTAASLITAPEAEQPQGLEPPGSPQPGGAAPPEGGEAGAGADGGAEVREAE